MNCKSLKVRVVPWFSTEEWDCVCKWVYSDDITEQTKGYEQLLVWKARVPTLPASVSCTLELLQVHLQDQVLWPKICRGEVPSYSELELRLAYSTVIMRFLNHLASLFQNTKNQTLYSVAKKLHIPVWVVNIRHDAAHDSSLPPVEVLRLAADHALGWLHEYWWKPEAMHLSDWKLTEDSHDDNMCHVELRNLLDLWQALKLYAEISYQTMDEIPDKEVSGQVSILRSKIDSNSTCNEPVSNSDVEITADYNCARGMSIHAASSLVLLHIKKFVGEMFPVHDWDQILLNNLVGEGMFAPSLLSEEDWLHVENNKLPPRCRKMWEPVLACLPVSVLIHLMKKLLTVAASTANGLNNQSRLAALWVREMAMAVTKLRRMLDLVEEISATAKNGIGPSKTVKIAEGICINLNQNDKFARLSPKTLIKKLVACVEEENPELKDVLVLGFTTLPDSKETYELLKLAVLNPSQLTPIFLPSVLQLIDPAAPAEMQCNLMLLVELYTQSVDVDAEVDVDAPVFTVSNLISSSAKNQLVEGERNELVQKDSGIEDMEVEERENLDQLMPPNQNKRVSESCWQRCQVNAKWDTCPLGVLPWQRHQAYVDLTSSDCTWQSPKELEAASNIGKPRQLLHKTIKWEDVKKRRQKNKGTPNANSKIIQTALEAVSHSTVRNIL